MKLDLYNQTGEIVGNTELPDRIFGVALNHDLVQQVLQAQVANAREVLAHTKDRSEVRGGGKKPWKQKGTGRARHASIRSPIWKGGGVAFGPTKDRNFSKKINKKMKRKALFMVLSSKIDDKELMALEGLKFSAAKTKEAVVAINALTSKMEGYKLTSKKRDKVLFVLPGKDQVVERAMQNVPFVEIIEAKNLNIRDMLNYKYLVLEKDAVGVIEKTFKI